MTSIFIDGASRGNPGPSSVGAVFFNEDGSVLSEISEFIGVTTNNTAEYSAFIFALQEAVYRGLKQIKVCTDSQLLARQFSGEYKVKEPHIKILFRIAKQLAVYFDTIEVCHVPREENQHADGLANQALDLNTH